MNLAASTSVEVYDMIKAKGREHWKTKQDCLRFCFHQFTYALDHNHVILLA